jgi:hypothetical protein
MPDTTILKTPNGWIDRDEPNAFHGSRRLARDARRASKGKSAWSIAGFLKPGSSLGSKTITNVMPSVFNRTTSVTFDSSRAPLTSLQQKLYDRFTTEYLMSPAEAREIVTQWTYNKAASYGHIRAAGVSMVDARQVVEMGDPRMSLNYGKSRALGLTHELALDLAKR